MFAVLELGLTIYMWVYVSSNVYSNVKVTGLDAEFAGTSYVCINVGVVSPSLAPYNSNVWFVDPVVYTLSIDNTSPGFAHCKWICPLLNPYPESSPQFSSQNTIGALSVQ